MTFDRLLSSSVFAGTRIRALLMVPVAFAVLVPASLSAQLPPDGEARMAAQRQAMERLSALDGAWRGTAVIHDRGGKTTTLTQTERVGPLLDGTIRLIEGRGYDAEGVLVFNAFAVLSYDPERERYSMRSSTHGHSGDFDFEATDDGFAWERPAGEGRVRYEAIVDGATWHQTGRYLPATGAPVLVFEMDLERIGDTDWPAAGAPGPAD
jgi:hypothetical protein